LLACGLLSLLIAFSAARGQESLPRIGYAYPAGGRQGTTIQITLGGQFLTDIGRVTISGDGVEARVVQGIKPMTEEQVRGLRDRFTELMRGKPDSSARLEAAELLRKIVRYNSASMRRQIQPAISETAAVEVAIRADAEPGLREIRVETARGVSNPLRFCVGQLPEFREREPDLVPATSDYSSPLRFPPTVTTDITLPAVVNGQIIPRDPDVLWAPADRFTPGDADRYRFEVRKGQQLIVAVSARTLIPYLADAVPGWFQATVALFDAQGKELAFDDDYRFHPDPVLVFNVPQDGQYVVEIKDAIYRGRPDFVYRITIGELPFITGIFPLGGPADKQTAVTLTGYNLPVDKLTVDAKDKGPGIQHISAREGDLLSNNVPFAIDTLPECLEREPNDASVGWVSDPTESQKKPSKRKPNDSAGAPQPVTLPIIVNGRIDRPGDWDVFRLEGRAGQQIIAEVNARRLDSPVDSVLELTDAAGQRLAFNDDLEDKADALHTHHADSLIRFTLPADGTYYVRLGDAQRKGGAEYAYRLRISPPRPDFALRVVPSCINAVAWRLTPITIFALRKDGFSGDIALSFKDNPEGILLTGGVIPAGQDRIRVTLALASWLPAEPQKVRLEGRATIDGAEVVHEAVPADDMMQAFAYKHLVPAQDLKLVLTDRPRFQASTGSPAQPRPAGRRVFESPQAILSELPAKIPVGGFGEVQIRGPWSAGGGDLQLELSDPPAGVVIDKVSWQDRIASIALRGEADKAKPGLRGNLIVNVFQTRTETNKEGKTREYRTFRGPLPAIPFEIVQP
jgi:hypothetical protein